MKFAFTHFGSAPGGTPLADVLGQVLAAVERRLPSALPWIAFVLAAAIVATIAGRQLWLIFLPEKAAIVMVAPASPPLLAGTLQGRHLFGDGGRGTGAKAVDPGDLRLLGTVTGEGVALIAADGKAPRAYRIGDEITPGMRLAAIGVRTVEIDRHGVRSSLQISAGRPPVPQR